MLTDQEKALATEMSKKLDSLLTVIIAGGVGLQFKREDAKTLLELTNKIKSGEVK